MDNSYTSDDIEDNFSPIARGLTSRPQYSDLDAKIYNRYDEFVTLYRYF